MNVLAMNRCLRPRRCIGAIFIKKRVASEFSAAKNDSILAHGASADDLALFKHEPSATNRTYQRHVRLRFRMYAIRSGELAVLSLVRIIQCDPFQNRKASRLLAN